MKRKFVLPDLDTFQKRLADFFGTVKAQKEQEQLNTQAYMEAIYSYHKLGMSLREISTATKIPLSTVAQWIDKLKAKEQPPNAQKPNPS